MTDGNRAADADGIQSGDANFVNLGAPKRTDRYKSASNIVWPHWATE